MTDGRSHLTRYVSDGARDWQAVEAVRRYRRDAGVVRANMVEHWEEREIDDPRGPTIHVAVHGGVAITRDAMLAVAFVQAANRDGGVARLGIGER